MSTLIASRTQISFGEVDALGTKTISETLTNSGDRSASISQAEIMGSGFALSGLSSPVTLAPGEAVTFGVTFAPFSNGTFTGNISIISDASDPDLTIPLSGTGLAQGKLSIAPDSINFGTTPIGASTSRTATLTADESSVTVSSVTIDNTDFSVTGLTLPYTLAPGQSAPVSVIFTPRVSETSAAILSITSSAVISPTTEALVGAGSAVQHSVDLSWNPSTSAVVGYNVYRGDRSGGPYTRINSELNVGTTFTDNSVALGATYYYVATAVDANGLESGYSNEATAKIPTE